MAINLAVMGRRQSALASTDCRAFAWICPDAVTRRSSPPMRDQFPLATAAQ